MNMRVQADLTELLKQVWVNGYITTKLKHHAPNYEYPDLPQKEAIEQWHKEIKKVAKKNFDLNAAIYGFKFEVIS